LRNLVATLGYVEFGYEKLGLEKGGREGKLEGRRRRLRRSDGFLPEGGM
jgi:hypothetical protein